MLKVFRIGDSVFYGIIPGKIIAIYNTDQCLFFASAERQGFSTCPEILNIGHISNTLFHYIHQYFGEPKSPALKKTLNERRFKILTLADLKVYSSEYEEYIKLVVRRHMLIKMTRTYIKTFQAQDKISNLVYKIDRIQYQIDMAEAKNQHLVSVQNNASYN